MKLYISAQARSIRDIKSNLLNHVDQIEENFVKLLIAPNASTRNHWQGEIASQIYRIRKIAGGNKIPSAKDIYKWIYTEQLPDLEDRKMFNKMVISICRIENFEIPADIDGLQKQFITVVEKYYSWLSLELSKDGYVDRGEIFKKLDTLV